MDVAANALGGVRFARKTKTSDNWPEMVQRPEQRFMAYASACNGEVSARSGIRPHSSLKLPKVIASMPARIYVLRKTEENSMRSGVPS